MLDMIGHGLQRHREQGSPLGRHQIELMGVVLVRHRGLQEANAGAPTVGGSGEGRSVHLLHLQTMDPY